MDMDMPQWLSLPGSFRNDWGGPRLAENALVLGPSESINQAFFEVPSLEQTVESTTQPVVSQQPGVPESPNLVARAQE